MGAIAERKLEIAVACAVAVLFALCVFVLMRASASNAISSTAIGGAESRDRAHPVEPTVAPDTGDGRFNFELFDADREELVQTQTTAGDQEPPPQSTAARVINPKEISERVGAWNDRQIRAGRTIAALGVPLDPMRLTRAIDASANELGGGATLDAIIRAYGPRDIWQAATTCEQKAAILGLCMEDDDLSELLDIPTATLRMWRDEIANH